MTTWEEEKLKINSSKVTECPNCGNKYQNIAHHWSTNSNCSEPEPSDKEYEIIKGCVMGDGNICWQKERGYNPVLAVYSVEKEYLKYLFKELGVWSNNLRISNTAEEQKEAHKQLATDSDSPDNWNANDLYELRTRSAEFLKEFGNWYENDENKKSWPDDLQLTPTSALHWYLGDGHLAKRKNGRPSITIGAYNERERPDFLKGLFEKSVGITPTVINGQINLTTEQTYHFLKWIQQPSNGPVPGYEHKFHKYESTPERWENRANRE